MWPPAMRSVVSCSFSTLQMLLLPSSGQNTLNIQFKEYLVRGMLIEKHLFLLFTVLRSWLSKQKYTVKKSDDASKHQNTEVQLFWITR